MLIITRNILHWTTNNLLSREKLDTDQQVTRQKVAYDHKECLPLNS